MHRVALRPSGKVEGEGGSGSTPIPASTMIFSPATTGRRGWNFIAQAAIEKMFGFVGYIVRARLFSLTASNFEELATWSCWCSRRRKKKTQTKVIRAQTMYFNLR